MINLDKGVNFTPILSVMVTHQKCSDPHTIMWCAHRCIQLIHTNYQCDPHTKFLTVCSVSHEHSDSTGLTQWRQMFTVSTFAVWLSAEADRLLFYYVTNQGHRSAYALHPQSRWHSSHWWFYCTCACPLLLFLTVMWCQMSATSVIYVSLLHCQQMYH